MPSHHRHGGRRTQTAVSTQQALKEIFNRNFTIVALMNLLVMTIYYLTFITSTTYAREAYEASLSTAGFTAGIMVIGCLAGRFVTGNLLSLFGSRNILFTGIVMLLGSILFFFYACSLPLLFLQRLLVGIGVGIIGTATGTIIAYVVPLCHHGLGISLFSLSTALALAFGPFLGIILLRWIDYQAINSICCGAGAACLLLFFLLKALPETRKRHRPFWELNSYIDPRVVRFSLVALVTCLSYGCVQAFMTSFAAERNLTSAASVFFLCYGLAAIGTRPITGRMFDVRGENIIFYPCLLLTSIALVLMAKAHSSGLLLLSSALLGVGFGNFQSASQSVSLSLVSKSRFAQATTTFYVFFDLGIGLGPYLFGFLVPSMGYEGMYEILALSVLGAVVMYHFLHGRHVWNIG